MANEVITMGSDFSNQPFQLNGTGIHYVMKNLKKGDYTVREFTTKKTWEFTTDTGSINYYQTLGLQPLRILYPENHRYFGNIVNLSSSLYTKPFNSQSLDPKLLWYYLDHNHYKDYDNIKNSSTVSDYNSEIYLSESGSMLLLPRKMVGEGIVEKSFQVTNNNITTASQQYSLKDDGQGNLIDTAFDTSKFIDKERLLLYVGFNEKYREAAFKKKRKSYVVDYSLNQNLVEIINPSKINYSSGIITTDTSQSTGVSAIFNDSYLRVKENNRFNFLKSQDFSFSFWINVPPSQSNTQYTYNNLFNKNTIKPVDNFYLNDRNDSPLDKFEYYKPPVKRTGGIASTGDSGPLPNSRPGGIGEAANSPAPPVKRTPGGIASTSSIGQVQSIGAGTDNTGMSLPMSVTRPDYVFLVSNKMLITDEVRPTIQYPFDISITNNTDATPHKIKFKQSSTIHSTEATSSQLTTGVWNHVVCQKSGSLFQIWLNGTLQSSVSSSIDSMVTNDRYLFIAGNGTNSGSFSGSMDEIRVYNKGLTSTEIQYLRDNSFNTGYAYQTARVGNIFYKTGVVSVVDPRPKYKNALLGKEGNFDYNSLDYGFTGTFKSKATFFEHEIICKIRKNEFNFTQNPSIKKNRDSEVSQIEDYVTSSFFNPYVTTIGLYNDTHELIAIAKLANPTAKRDDVDMNFIIRFDQ